MLPSHTTDPIILLRRVPLFANLDDDTVNRISGYLRRRTFKANETLFFAGDPGFTLYLIVAGSVKICRSTPDGDRIVIAMLGPGKPFGEMSLLDGGPRSADAIVAEPAEILMLDRDGFRAVLQENAQVALDLLAVMADRLRRTNDSVNVSAGLPINGRVARQLLELAEMYGVDVPGATPTSPVGRRIHLKVTQQEIAEMVGCTRESVNKALAGFRREKALTIDNEGYIRLQKMALLKRRAEGM